MTSTLPVVAGADTHSQTHHVAVLDAATPGALLADRQFPATTAGYRAILAFMAPLGHLSRFGVEGTNSYVAGLSRFLRYAGHDVREVIPPQPGCATAAG
jgi:transposase